MLWEVEIEPAPGRPDRAAKQVMANAADLRIGNGLSVQSAYGYLIEGELSRESVQTAADRLLCDLVVERHRVGQVGDALFGQLPAGKNAIVHVLPKPGVMDPVAQSAQGALSGMGLPVKAVRSFRKYYLAGLDKPQTDRLCSKVLANDAIEQVVHGPLAMDRLALGMPYTFNKVEVQLSGLSDRELLSLSKQGQLHLSLPEMQAVRDYFAQQGRHPTDIELETFAQTWSEHCSHKTLRGEIHYRSDSGERVFGNLLKETIFQATQTIRQNLGPADWCVSVFADNAGVVRFDGETNVCFKVETHNHPSALEPYGGANTGIGGVIRDTLGTGLGAKPVCNTDVFCFAPPHMPVEQVPQGALHPRRVFQGVVAGVRDYGNRMGIPTVNGAIYFDERYVGNPLVYCGNVGVIPHDKSFKSARPGDLIVALGGRTGRDGIHGATFSSVELTSASEQSSGGAVQIGNAITEKVVADVVLAARDRGLYTAITDCGAGGFSSAIGEMAAEIGAVVWLERAPLKYDGLSYTEIWISEAQERMVLAVPPEQWDAFDMLARQEGTEAVVVGQLQATGRLVLKYHDQVVGDLDMHFLHEGRPKVVRQAVFHRPAAGPGPASTGWAQDPGQALLQILGSLNVASKEWVIRQYDHEVQGGSIVKPLVGIDASGPGDAAVVRPIFNTRKALAISCGMNPRYGDLDPYHMAQSALDEAVRNCVAVGANPARIAVLDNFCWGDVHHPQTLGLLVRAALGCHDLAVALGTPFISGKDSLHNVFQAVDAAGNRRQISIPPSLLISALGQLDDVSHAVTMDLKAAGNWLFLVGSTLPELGGSHLGLVRNESLGQVPRVDASRARQTFAQLHLAISRGLVRACHDLSEGGLAVAAAEMAFAGGIGAELFLDQVMVGTPADPAADYASLNAATQPAGKNVRTQATLPATLLFSESNTRLLCEVPAAQAAAFSQAMQGVPCSCIGQTVANLSLAVYLEQSPDGLLFQLSLADMKEAWQAPLRW